MSTRRKLSWISCLTGLEIQSDSRNSRSVAGRAMAVDMAIGDLSELRVVRHPVSVVCGRFGDVGCGAAKLYRAPVPRQVSSAGKARWQESG